MKIYIQPAIEVAKLHSEKLLGGSLVVSVNQGSSTDPVPTDPITDLPLGG